ncbi:MAG TPA: HAMP domain-containing sensor histidine kinase [Trebonia sp.]|nr:HAMP domain-containing sensor histidine kinase [Trebonia sp.]
MAGADMAEETSWTASSETKARRRWSPWGAGKRLSDRTPLRTKLIASVLALVIMALAAISVASVVVLRTYLYTQRDNQLRQSFSHIAGELATSSGIQLNYPYPVGSGMIAAFQKPGSQLVAGNTGPTLPGMSGSSRPQQSLPELPGGNWANSQTAVLLTVPPQSGGDTWRVIAQAVTVTENSTNTQLTTNMLVAVDLGPVGAEVHRLIAVELIVGTAIVVVLAVVGVAVVRANLRPLDDIEMTAGEIAKGHLDHRVPERDPRTEIGSLGRSLNAMLSQIERAFHAQGRAEQAAHESEERMRRFVADAAHELRTPLTTIRGFAAHYRQRGGASSMRPGEPGPNSSFRTEAADSGALTASPVAVRQDGMSPEDLDHLVGRVEAEATRMGLLVEDLLTLARLDQQRPLAKAPVDLLTLAVDAVQDARIVSPGRPIDLIVAPGTAFLVDGDEPRLRQVMANLVNNAITHTPAGTPVRVKIARGTLAAQPADRAGSADGPAEQDGWGGSASAADASRAPGREVPAIVLDVEDDGPGMSAEQAQRVFERFYRADAARNRASGGTGLGLAIVAGLVSAHGGTVSVRTAPGQGADFQVKLPLSPDALAVDDADDDVTA